MKRVFVFALLIALPAAQAHVNASLVAPDGPVAPGEVVAVPVTLSANCAVVLAEYDADNRSPLVLNAGEAPAALLIASDDLPFTSDMCDTSPDPARFGNVFSTGNLYIAPTLSAPAGTLISLTVGATNANDGAETVQGDITFDLAIGFAGSVVVANIEADAAGPESMIDIPITLLANGAGSVEFTVLDVGAMGNATVDGVDDPDGMDEMEGMDHGDHKTGAEAALHIADIDFESPLIDGAPLANVTHQAHFVAPIDAWEHVSFQLEAVLVGQDGSRGSAVPFEIHIQNVGDTGGHDHSAHEHGNEEAPGLAMPLVMLGLVALAIARRC